MPISNDRTRRDAEPDGRTPETAIQEDQAIWCREHCPDFTVVLQTLLSVNGKLVDCLTLRSPAGEVWIRYFDVSTLHSNVLPRDPPTE